MPKLVAGSASTAILSRESCNSSPNEDGWRRIERTERVAMLPIEKGNLLEDAVHAIEAVILKSSPSLRENTFTIESKRRIGVDGVRHEIDLHVEVDLGKGYKSVFIFECKNQEEAVSKNDIIIFSEKIKASRAQQGFFVAKSYSRDAKAQAKKDPRIVLLLATEIDAALTPVPFHFHVIFVDRSRIKSDVVFINRGASMSDNQEKVQFSIQDIRFLLHGSEIDFQQYINQWSDEIIHDHLLSFPSAKLDEGDYQRETSSERHFEGTELVINDLDVETLKLNAEYVVVVARPAVISHFEVESRGRSVSLAPLQLGGVTIKTGLVAIR